jgi:plasmid stabilization system protein ParE
VAGYRLSPNAREGLQEILEYVEEQFGVDVADEVLEEMSAAFELIVESPRIGHHREDLTRDTCVRFWLVGPTLIAYRTGARDYVEILFVERAERDWEGILGDGA